MHARHTSTIVRISALSFAAAVLGACGARIEGTYSGNGSGFLDSITLKSGGQVNIQFMGMTKQGTYEIDGREVSITVANDTQVLRIDDRGCLVGGGLLGTYCKGDDGDAPAADREEREQRLAGTYEAGDSRDGIRLEFEDDGMVRMTMREGGATGNSAQGTYEIDGNRIRIAVPGEQGLELVRDGDTLESTVGYATLRFEKR